MDSAVKWETLPTRNAQIPEGWAGRDGLLYEREESIAPAYDQPEIHDTAINSHMRSKARACACGCGAATPRHGYEYLAFIPGHRKTLRRRRAKL